MARCSGLSALAPPDLPSRAANGLDTGFGDGGAGVACARAASAALGIAELAARGTIDPVVLGGLPAAGRGAGSGMLCAKAGAAVRQINKDASNPAIATMWIRAVCPAIRVSASAPLQLRAGCCLLYTSDAADE